MMKKYVWLMCIVVLAGIGTVRAALNPTGTSWTPVLNNNTDNPYYDDVTDNPVQAWYTLGYSSSATPYSQVIALTHDYSNYSSALMTQIYATYYWIKPSNHASGRPGFKITTGATNKKDQIISPQNGSGAAVWAFIAPQAGDYQISGSMYVNNYAISSQSAAYLTSEVFTFTGTNHATYTNIATYNAADGIFYIPTTTVYGMQVGDMICISNVGGYNTAAGGGEVYINDTNSGTTTPGLVTVTLMTSTQTATPTCNPVGGTYSSAQTVAIDCTDSATIRYTTDNSTPTTSSTEYTGPLTISETTTLKACAWADGMDPSSVVTEVYTISIPVVKTATPAFSLEAGTYTGTQSVTITCADTATIRYTTDNSEPSTTNGTVITSGNAVNVDHSLTLKAKAWADGKDPSDTQTATYTLVTATPTFTPSAGTYSSEQTVTITSEDGATIYYTLDSSTPTTGSSVYSSALSISTNTTLKACALKTGKNLSSVATANYYISTGGGHSTGTSWTPVLNNNTANPFYDTVTGNPIQAWYTLGYSTSATPYSQVIALTHDYSNYANALMTQIYATYYWVKPSNHSSGRPGFKITTGSTNKKDQLVSPANGSGAAIWAFIVPQNGDYRISGSVYVDNAYNTNSANYLTAEVFTFTGTGHTTYTNIGTYNAADGVFNISTTTVYGMQIGDMICISNIGGFNTAAGGGQVYINDTNAGTTTPGLVTITLVSSQPQTTTPSFTPPAGTYSAAQSVAITSETGATIRYTTDTTDPTTSSTQYTGALAISTNTTLKARAWADGKDPSEVATAAYIIELPETRTATPFYSIAGGTYTSPLNVGITCTDSGSTIRYTTDGSAPDEYSTLYTGPVAISVNTTLRAKAWAEGKDPSYIMAATYYFTTATPTFNPPGGSYSSAQSVAITSESGATIYYTLDDSTPTTGSSVYSSPISISTNTTLKACALKTGKNLSNVETGNYYISTGGSHSIGTSWTPVLNETINNPHCDILTNNPIQAWYTIGFTTVETPFATCIAQTHDYSLYAGGLMDNNTYAVSAGTWLKTGCVDGSNHPRYLIADNKGRLTSAYWYRNASVWAFIAPQDGCYQISGSLYVDNGNDVQAGFTEPAASYNAYIMAEVFTLTGISHSTYRNIGTYRGPDGVFTIPTRGVTMNTGDMICISNVGGQANQPGMNWGGGMLYINDTNSGTTTPALVTITLVNPRTQMPSFSVESGLYGSQRSVTITSEAGATIRYTTNGDDPDTGSTQYTGALAISTNTTLKARAWIGGKDASDIATAVYTFVPAATLAICDEIRAEATRANDDEIGRPLPLAAHWQVGQWGYPSFDPNWQLSLIDAGHHVLPAFRFPDPSKNWEQTYESMAGYYDIPFKKAIACNLPVTFMSMQWEDVMTYQTYWSRTWASGTNPNTFSSSTGNVYTWDFTPTIKRGYLDPMGPTSVWREVGEDWVDAPIWETFQSMYPNPPKVIMLSNNEAKKVTWSNYYSINANTSKRFTDAYGTSTTDEFKRTTFGNGWTTLYREMQDAMRDKLNTTGTWGGSNTSFVAYGAFGPGKFRCDANWHKFSLPTNTRIDPNPLAWDGGSVSCYLLSLPTDYKVSCTQTVSQNWPFMLKEALNLNPNFFFELSMWDGNGDEGNAVEQMLAAGQTYTPERYKGWVQFCMWVARPRVVREYRANYERRDSNGPSSATVPYTNTGYTNEEFFVALCDGVDRVHTNATLKDFWRKGELVQNTAESHPYQDATYVPTNYTDALINANMGGRWFMLTCSANPARPWLSTTVLKVLSVALVKGTTPNRQWLVYAHAPVAQETGVSITLPVWGTLSNLTVPRGGAFWLCTEGSGTPQLVTD